MKACLWDMRKVHTKNAHRKDDEKKCTRPESQHRLSETSTFYHLTPFRDCLPVTVTVPWQLGKPGLRALPPHDTDAQRLGETRAPLHVRRAHGRRQTEIAVARLHEFGHRVGGSEKQVCQWSSRHKNGMRTPIEENTSIRPWALTIFATFRIAHL